MEVKFRDADGYRELTCNGVKSISKGGGEHKNYIVHYINGEKEVVKDKVVWMVSND